MSLQVLSYSFGSCLYLSKGLCLCPPSYQDLSLSLSFSSLTKENCSRTDSEIIYLARASRPCLVLAILSYDKVLASQKSLSLVPCFVRQYTIICFRVQDLYLYRCSSIISSTLLAVGYALAPTCSVLRSVVIMLRSLNYLKCSSLLSLVTQALSRSYAASRSLLSQKFFFFFLFALVYQASYSVLSYVVVQGSYNPFLIWIIFC